MGTSPPVRPHHPAPGSWTRAARRLSRPVLFPPLPLLRSPPPNLLPRAARVPRPAGSFRASPWNSFLRRSEVYPLPSSQCLPAPHIGCTVSPATYRRLRASFPCIRVLPPPLPDPTGTLPVAMGSAAPPDEPDRRAEPIEGHRISNAAPRDRVIARPAASRTALAVGLGCEPAGPNQSAWAPGIKYSHSHAISLSATCPPPTHEGTGYLSPALCLPLSFQSNPHRGSSPHTGNRKLDPCEGEAAPPEKGGRPRHRLIASRDRIPLRPV